jgi:methionyl-tRNA formyltransferase
MLDPGEDTGDVVAEAPFEISPGMSGRQALERAALAAAPLLVRSVRALQAGDLVRTLQRKEGAGRCPRPSPQDCRVDPGLSAEQVYTYVAGCAGSYPVFVECGGDRFFIATAVSFDVDAPMSFEYLLSGDQLLLRCRPGVVELELKPGGALFTAEYEEETLEGPADQRG